MLSTRTTSALEAKSIFSIKPSPLHLVLFFDINGTIIASDVANGKDSDSAIIQLLAENYSGKWSDKVDSMMTYRKYVDTYLCPGDGKNGDIKAARRASYKDFLNFLDRTNHPDKEKIKNDYKKLKSVSNKPGENIFPSFISLLKYLKSNKIPFSIVFRTFGLDLDAICEEVERRTSKAEDLKQIKIHSRGVFTAGELKIKDSDPLTTSEEMLAYIKPFQHSGWRDDWQYWSDHKETHLYGKPFPLDLSDDKKIAIFFDDNATDKSILAAKVIGEDGRDQVALQTKLVELGHIVPVNTLQAILNEDYFIKHVEFKMKMSQQAVNVDKCEFKL